MRAKARAYRKTIPIERDLYHHALARARERGLDFNIEISDIVIPRKCPILGIRIHPNKGGKYPTSHSPSLDRINPKRGYVKGNVMVISHRANALKSNATLKEIRAVYDFVRSLQ